MSNKSEVKITAMELRRDFGEVVDGVIAGVPHVITRHGRPVMVLISARDYDQLKQAANKVESGE